MFCSIKNLSYINIEITNRCNFACKMCYRNRMQVQQGEMDRELFNYIVEKLKQEKLKLKAIYLHWRGEPLLNDKIPYCIKKIKKELDFPVILFTNGFLLREKLAKEILDSNIDEIFISLHASSSLKFEEITGTNGFSKVIRNVNNLFEMKISQGYFTHINILTVITNDNINEIFSLKRQFENVADRFIIREDSGAHIFSKKTKNCEYPWNTLVINYKGDVFPCCQDVNESINLGNIRREKFSQIWNSPNICKLRDAIKGNSKHLPAVCEKCIGKLEEQIEE